MYFITNKDSETGKKFQEIVKAKDKARSAQVELAEKYGFESFRAEFGVLWGGISSCINFINPPESKVWRKVNNDEYFPKRNNKEGKAIYNDITSLPCVEKDDLNKCLDFKGAPMYTIGFAFNNDDYFGFVTDKNWGIKIPKDCKEVLESKYDDIFKG